MKLGPFKGLALVAVRIIIIGGGIAGATAACHLAPDHEVVLLEQERELAHHTTGRSAAVFLEGDAGPVIQSLARGGRSFLQADHPELDAPLLEPLPVLVAGAEAERDELATQAEADAELTPSIRFVEGTELTELCPILRPEVLCCGVLEPTAASIDVMSLHRLYLTRAVRAGAEVRRSSPAEALDRTASGWRVSGPGGVVDGDVVVNAAGAWGDRVAARAGVEPVGLTPMRRTAFTSPTTHDTTGWPFVYCVDADHPCYFKPETGGQLLCSLADETPSEPVDARPEEIDVAQAIDHLNTVTTLGLRSVRTAWAGLRTFAPDRVPVFGFDDAADGFFWLVGQGGWGIISSVGAGRVVAAAVAGEPLPADLAATGLTYEALAPRRGGDSV